jgi:hypothetical protein
VSSAPLSGGVVGGIAEGRRVVGTPSLKSRTRCASLTPFSDRLAPTMSLENMPSMLAPAALYCFAWKSDPKRPSSSPSTAVKTMVDSGLCVARTRATSTITATPEASSSAPG